VNDLDYFMESEWENIRLDTKTDPAAVEQQAIWAEIKPGMRIADLGCGSGKTTSILHELAQPGGRAVGVDFSKGRVEYARLHYAIEGAEFVHGDIRLPLDGPGTFDLVWIRFVLEYYRSNAIDIVRNVSSLLKPGGTLCLIDLDLNCLNHFCLSDRLSRTIIKCARTLEETFNFDPYAGRKLYSFLYDNGYEDIAVSVGAHHVIYGELRNMDGFNWLKKIEIANRKASFDFEEYPGGCAEFTDEFTRFFSDPRRFSYTPIILARGRRSN
jgi:SAM-dependent methyltransferase